MPRNSRNGKETEVSVKRQTHFNPEMVANVNKNTNHAVSDRANKRKLDKQTLKESYKDGKVKSRVKSTVIAVQPNENRRKAQTELASFEEEGEFVQMEVSDSAVNKFASEEDINAHDQNTDSELDDSFEEETGFESTESGEIASRSEDKIRVLPHPHK